LSILSPPILFIIHTFFAPGGEPIKPDEIGSINVPPDATRVVFDEIDIAWRKFPKNAHLGGCECHAVVLLEMSAKIRLAQ